MIFSFYKKLIILSIILCVFITCNPTYARIDARTKSQELIVCLDYSALRVNPRNGKTLSTVQDIAPCERRSPDGSRVLLYDPKSMSIQVHQAHQPEVAPKIAYRFNPKDNGLWQYRWMADGTYQLIIVSARDSLTAPTASVCQNALPFTALYERCWEGHEDVYIVVEGAPMRRLTHYEAPICEARFVPDQALISFRKGDNCINGATSSDSFVVDIKTTHTYAIHTARTGQDYISTLASWSRDGKKVALTQMDFNGFPKAINSFAWATLEQVLAGLPAKVITETSTINTVSSLFWSTDSRYLAQVVNADLLIYDTSNSTSKLLPLSKLFTPAYTCRAINKIVWSPDNQHLGIVCDYGGITFYDVKKGATTQFTNKELRFDELTWSADSLYAAYQSFRGNISTLYLFNTSMGQSVTLMHSSEITGSIRELVWSYD